MRVDAVLFDLFDTLLLLQSDRVYYEPCLRRMHKFLTERGINVSFEDFSKVYFEVRDRFYSESRKSLEEPHFNVRVSQTLHKLGYDFDVSDPVVIGATESFASEFMRYVRLDEDAPEVLESLHQRFKLGLVSNFGIPECGHELLKTFGLERFFDVIVISAEVNQRKPSAEIFRRALKALKTDASRAVFVGDMIDLDVAGPKNVGMKTVLIEREPRKVGVNPKPDIVIKRLTELLTLVEKS